MFSLAAEGKPQDQGLGKSGLRHPILHRFNIIRDAPEFDRMILEVSDRKSGARITVTRLADRARIDKIRRAPLDRQSRVKIPSRWLQIQDRHLLVTQGKSALDVRMAEKSDRRRSFEKTFQRLCRSKHVFL